MNTPDVEPLMSGHVPDVDFEAHEPDVAGKYVGPSEGRGARILLWMTLDHEEYFDDLVDTLIHENLHYTLHKVEGFETSKMLDNVVDRDNRLSDGDIRKV